MSRSQAEPALDCAIVGAGLDGSGRLRVRGLNQISTAAGEGAIAATRVHNVLRGDAGN